MTPAPTLHTRRLTLRGPIKADLTAFTDMVVSSPRLAAFDENGTETDAWRGFISGIGHWHWHGYGFFVIDDTATGTAQGRVGLLNHVGWPEPELAYHVYDHAEGKSIAYEAACAVRQWAGDHLGLGPLVSIIEPHNARSRALATRLGGQLEKSGPHDGHDAVFYRHLAHDDPKAQAQWAEVAA